MDLDDLYRRYGPMVLRRCRQLLRDEELAREATQDVFVQLLRRRDRMSVQAPSSLLYRVATNTCLNIIRSRGRRPEHPDDELLSRIAAAPEIAGPAEARSTLRLLFSREPERRVSSRTIATLHLLDGMTLQEVADEVGLSVSGVRKRLATLRRHLHELEAVEAL